MNKVWQPELPSHRQTALATNSGPLSLRMCFGTPRVRNSHSSTSTTPEAGIDGATLMARHSLVYSSIMTRILSLPPRSPKLNGHVERAQRTHTEEFYEVTEANFEIGELNQALLEWEKVYNTIRPHQALGYLTPQQFLEQCQQKRGEVMCH